MSAQIIDGKHVAGQIKARLAQEVRELKSQGIVPGLAVVLVGDNPASRVYVNMKKKACGEIGIYSREYTLDGGTTQEHLLGLIQELNNDGQIHGILVQLPLPAHMDESQILEAIDPAKDVDGFHPVNVGKLVTGQACLLPCTPAGIMELIDATGLEIEGKEAVVVGRSNIVGKPLAHLLLARNATVTVCHSRTKDLPGVCRRADILVAAVGRPEMVKGHWIKEGAVVIDVGVNRTKNGSN
jgi:methylenetetrahydrofolate dehydrogenase (NADP+)/methenyltetrahydrofolate cyclohydrolase